MSGANLYLDNSQYYSGNRIIGQAVCFFRNKKDIREIRIRLKGKESTKWSGAESYHHSKSYFLKEDLIVHGEGTIGEGRHEFPFTFTLPEDIPASYTHKLGKIVFSVKLTVDRPWKTDFKEKTIITIISPINLQRIPSHLQLSQIYPREETPCVCCCCIGGNGPVQVNLFLNKRAFVVGEAVNMKVCINNMSNKYVESFKVTLKMKIEFKAASEYKWESYNIFKFYNRGVEAHTDKTYDLSPVIPVTTVVPNFTGCCFSNIEIKTDVAVGHVPQPITDLDLPEPITLQPMPIPMPVPLPGELELHKNSPDSTSSNELPPPNYYEAMKNMYLTKSSKCN